MISFYSHGKLLLTGEYTVLKGANALAIPCKMGQTLNYRQTDDDILIWKSYNVNNIVWFEVKFKVDSLKLISTSDLGIWKSLLKILRATKELNFSFLFRQEVIQIVRTLINIATSIKYIKFLT